MTDMWTFGPAEDDTETYGDGTQVPHRKQIIYRNGQPVGEIEIHAHRRAGPDRITDLSFGITCVTYGPLPERKTPDTW
ncbi:hypothetical protein ACFY1J_30955 [Streptomyces sp. NPDC001406]|uniref:hypothetical protein n=1 Tax=Streptomyces sp. NPDC001406 TaxID=3364572 RepID=UPI00369A28E5